MPLDGTNWDAESRDKYETVKAMRTVLNHDVIVSDEYIDLLPLTLPTPKLQIAPTAAAFPSRLSGAKGGRSGRGESSPYICATRTESRATGRALVAAQAMDFS